MLDKGEAMPVGTEKILLVDDDISVIKITKMRLERLGYQVKGVEDPVKALAAFQAESDEFDLVITDMVMPNMDGAQFAQALLKQRPELPVILWSGYSPISAKDILKTGICKFIEKPVEIDHLACCIRQAIDKK